MLWEKLHGLPSVLHQSRSSASLLDNQVAHLHSCGLCLCPQLLLETLLDVAGLIHECDVIRESESAIQRMMNVAAEPQQELMQDPVTSSVFGLYSDKDSSNKAIASVIHSPSQGLSDTINRYKEVPCD